MENEEKKIETEKVSETDRDTERGNAETQKNTANLISDPELQIKKFGRGKFELAVPIRAASKDVTVLHYDFTKVNGMEYVEALDSDLRSTNAFKVTATQALMLFAVAAAKVTDGVDAIDIRSRMSAQDCVKAVQLSTVFFSACNRAGNRRISNE